MDAKILTKITVLWALALCLVSPSYAISLQIDPLIVERSVAPGGTEVVDIKITNTNDKESAHVVVEKLDWIYNPADGSKKFLDSGASKFSCAKMMELDKDKFEIGPGGASKIRVTLRPPTNMSGGCYSALTYHNDESAGTDGKAGVQTSVVTKIVGLFAISMKGASARKGEISSFDLSKPDENKPLSFHYQFKNTGNVRVTGKASVTLADSTNRSVAYVELPDIKTLPDDVAVSSADWTGQLEEGTYSALLTVSMGDSDVVVSEKKITVEKKLLIQDMMATSSKGKTTVNVALKNDGNFNLQATGSVKIIDASGKEIITAPLSHAALAPERTQTLTATQDRKLAAGTYTLHAEIDGPHGIVMKDTELKVK